MASGYNRDGTPIQGSGGAAVSGYNRDGTPIAAAPPSLNRQQAGLIAGEVLRGALPHGESFTGVLGGLKGGSLDILQGFYNAAHASAIDIKHNPLGAAGGSVLGGPEGAVLGAVGQAEATGHKSYVVSDVARPIAASYAYKYGPAFEGHPGTTLHRMAQDPVGTALDVLTLAAIPFTDGGSAAVRGLAGGLDLARAGKAAEALRAADAYGQTIRAGRTLSYVDEADKLKAVEGVGKTTQPLRALSQKVLDSASGARPGLPIFGTASRVDRIAFRRVVAQGLRAELAAGPYQRALKALTLPQQLAVAVIAHGVDRPSYLRLIDEEHAAVLKQMTLRRDAAVNEQARKAMAEYDGRIAKVDKSIPGLERRSKAHGKNVAPAVAKLGNARDTLASLTAGREAHMQQVTDQIEASIPMPRYEKADATQRLQELLTKHGDAIDQATLTWTHDPKMIHAVEEGKKLAGRLERIYTESPRTNFTAEAAARRVRRPAEAAAGARRLSKAEMRAEPIVEVRKAVIAANRAIAKQGRTGKGLEEANAALAAAEQAAHDAGLELAGTEDHIRLTGWTLPDTAKMEANRTLLDPAGHGEFYVPHTGPLGGGRRNLNNLPDPNLIPKEMRESTMFRFKMGDLLYHPQMLSRAYVRGAHWQHVEDVINFVSDHGKPLSDNRRYSAEGGPGVDPGYVLARRLPNDVTRGSAPPRVIAEHPAMKEGMRRIDAQVLDTEAYKHTVNNLLEDTFPKGSPENTSLAAMRAGGYFQVPKRIERMAKREVGQSTNGLIKFYDKFLDVWKAFVLYSRPAWLVNNIFGQHLLYAMFNMPGGLRAYLRAAQVKVDLGVKGDRIHTIRVVNPHGDAISDIPGMESIRAGGLNRSIGGHAAEGTVIPFERWRQSATRTGGGTLRTATVLPLGAARGIVRTMKWANYRFADDQTRLAAALNDPEFRSLHAHLNEWTGTIGLAKRMLYDYGLVPGKHLGERVSIDEALQQVPLDMAERITERGAKMLGDYREMSALERRYLARIFPFWGWYRTIGAIALRLPIENSIRANFIYNLEKAAQISGVGVPKFPLPSWLQGAVDLGHGPKGSERLLSTTGLNPFQTNIQVGTALGTALTGSPKFGGEGLLAVTTPLTANILEAGGIDPFYGGQYRGPLANKGAGGRLLASLGTGLPQYRLGQQETGFGGYKSTLYQQTKLDYLLNYLGLPIKNTNPTESRSRAAAGQ